MRVDYFLNVSSSKEAITFYVNELALFRIDIEYGMNTYLLSRIGNKSSCICIREGELFGTKSPLFGLEVESCAREFKRISSIDLSNGAKLVPDRNGRLVVSDFPTGCSFEMQDPSGNKFLIFEEYIFP